MNVATEWCSDLVLPSWQPPAEGGLVALVDAAGGVGWADRLLTRHGDGFLVWAATGGQPERLAIDLSATRADQLADDVITHGWNLSSRLHTLLWEDSRGR